MDGLAYLGADGLKNQYVVIRVMNVDNAKLRQAVSSSGWQSVALAAALRTADGLPKAAYDIGLPLAAKYLKDEYGIDAKVTAANVPPAEGGRDASEFFPGVAVGATVVGVVWVLGRTLGKLLLGGR